MALLKPCCEGKSKKWLKQDPMYRAPTSITTADRLVLKIQPSLYTNTLIYPLMDYTVLFLAMRLKNLIR